MEVQYTYFTTVKQAVEWITERKYAKKRPGLKRMELIMNKLGYPEKELKFIHIAGTNGKGSTCCFLTNILISCKFNVGTFTSPYIEKYQDRIQYNGIDIDDNSLLLLMNYMKPIFDQLSQSDLGAPSMFEISTALALMYFSKIAKPDFVVWETGIGGLLDSTNIVTPIISIITNVGHDHMDQLGDTIEEVAVSKAGIIKKGIPVVSSVEHEEAIRVIKDYALTQDAPLYLLNQEFYFETVKCEVNSQIINFYGPFQELINIEMGMNGSHQVKNLANVLMAMEILRNDYKFNINTRQLYEGIKQTYWPARLEMLSDSPQVLLDGAHNLEAMKALTESLDSVYKYNKLHLLIGMTSTKNHKEILEVILPLATTVIITEIDFFKKQDAKVLSDLANEILVDSNLIGKVIVEKNWENAFCLLINKSIPGDLGLITGSLYLTSLIRSMVMKNQVGDISKLKKELMLNGG
ncbi:bifunctional folylpolyglutamate synthase/dihydrofolate synthase [Paenibacillus solani]|uniref:bifunctional folylpolyglutamate synthase/dihydrofolate synthase n=1 Tax=Paenibacillus solani TaxID=1705565 RepID=UPI003D2D1FDC